MFLALISQLAGIAERTRTTPCIAGSAIMTNSSQVVAANLVGDTVLILRCKEQTTEAAFSTKWQLRGGEARAVDLPWLHGRIGAGSLIRSISRAPAPPDNSPCGRLLNASNAELSMRMISEDSLLTMVRYCLSQKNQHAGTAAMVRIGQHIDVGQHRFAVDGVERRAGLGAEFPAFLAEQRLGDRNRNHVVELLELAKNERAMRPLASMIADFANFSARLSRNLRPVVLTAISRSICRSDSVATCAACLSSASFFSSWRRSKLRALRLSDFPYNERMKLGVSDAELHR